MRRGVLEVDSARVAAFNALVLWILRLAARPDELQFAVRDERESVFAFLVQRQLACGVAFLVVGLEFALFRSACTRTPGLAGTHSHNATAGGPEMCHRRHPIAEPTRLI
jgi:hypothetical protein